MEKYVFAAVKYANAAPLAHYLAEADERAAVTYHRPSALPAELAEGRADAALVPVAAFLGMDGLRMIDGIGICADGRVESVLLKCHKPLDQVRLVQPDAASRTSNALTAVLLAEHWKLDAQVRMPRQGERPDAVVCIGDRALREPPGSAGDYDLAAMWKQFTHLPFVFAVWAYRAGHAGAGELANIARAGRDAGLARVAELAKLYAERLGLPVARMDEYFRRSVRYEVGPRERDAIELFRTKLVGLGMIEDTRSRAAGDACRADAAGKLK